MDSLGCCEKVGRKPVLLLWSGAIGDLGPLASYVAAPLADVLADDILNADLERDALVPVSVGSNVDAVRVDQGFLVDFQAKLGGQVPAPQLVESG